MFRNREEAGEKLSQRLKHLKDNLLVLAIPRGGVVVGQKVATAINCPLDVVVVRKLGAPGNPELAIGAVAPEKIVVWDKELISCLGVSEEYKKEELKRQTKELERREKVFRKDRPPLDLIDKVVIIVDDGIATGATTEAVIKWVKLANPQRIVLATPVAAFAAAKKLKKEVDEFICLETPFNFYAVGQFYEDFPQVEDEEVIEILKNKQISKRQMINKHQIQSTK